MVSGVIRYTMWTGVNLILYRDCSPHLMLPHPSSCLRAFLAYHVLVVSFLRCNNKIYSLLIDHSIIIFIS